VAHLTDGTLRRMVDDPDARVGADQAHLDGCAECKARLDAIADDARSIATLFAVPEPRVDVARAYARVTAAPKAQPALGLRLPFGRPVRLAFIAAVAAVSLVVVAFAASGLFFQPTKVKPVPITLSDLQALSQLGDYGTFAWTKEPQFQVTANAEDASAVAGGLKPPVVSKLPTGVSTTVTYAGMSQAEATFTFSQAKADAAAAAKGQKAPKLAANVDGATLTIKVGPAVGEVYGNMNAPSSGESEQINLPQLIVAMSAAPSVSSTQVSVSDLKNVILQQPGVSDELKKTISAISDPNDVLFIPVPIDYANSSTVHVQGVDGVALGDNTGVGSAVVWVKNGHVYAVAGSIKQSDAIDIANNLK
jgi:hypothetical protein